MLLIFSSSASLTSLGVLLPQYLKPFSEQNIAEKVCNLATCPTEMHELKDEELDRGPIPTQSVLRENVFILSRGLVPLAIQAICYYFFPSEFSRLPFSSFDLTDRSRRS